MKRKKEEKGNRKGNKLKNGNKIGRYQVIKREWLQPPQVQ